MATRRSNLTLEAYVRGAAAPQQIRLAELRGGWLGLCFFWREFSFILCPAAWTPGAPTLSELLAPQAS